jgi:Mitochondrial ribosomal protein (VAR1)
MTRVKLDLLHLQLEWFNSIYAYNHNYIKSLPVADKHLMSLLKSYFNMQIKDEKIKNKRNIIKNRRISTKRVFIGRGELKHSNNKVIITFYVYNTEAMFLWGNVKKAWEILYRPKKDIEISINEDTKDKEVISQYESFNLITWLKRLKNKYVLRTLINKKTKKENNMILFSKPIPNSKDYALDLKEIGNILNRLGYSKSLKKLKLTINEIDNTVAQKNISVNTKNYCLLLKEYQDILINIYIKKKKINKNIEKKFEIISFNRPLSLKHGQILPINEDINNKRIIKLNRPLSLNEFLFQFDFDTYIHNMQKNILLNKMNKYYSSLINLFETKVLSNKEISSIFNNKVKSIFTLFEEKKIWKKKIWHKKTLGLGRSVKQLYTFVNLIKREVKNRYRDAHLLLPLYLFRFNQTKFGMYLMEKLTHLVKNLYNKEVVFNIVNLKKMHLSSDIYTQAVVLKLKNRDNKLYRVLKSSLRKIKIPNFSKINEKNNKPNKKEFIDNKIRNSLINSMFTKEDVKDPLNNLLLKFFPSAENLQKSVVKKGSVKNCSISLKDYVLMYLKHIKVRGIRVEAKGRLTRRFTASRSVFKMKWKGGLKNVDSSFKGLSTIMLRGYVKSNAQYSFISSKNRNGAFGVKGWVSNK